MTPSHHFSASVSSCLLSDSRSAAHSLERTSHDRYGRHSVCGGHREWLNEDDVDADAASNLVSLADTTAALVQLCTQGVQLAVDVCPALLLPSSSHASAFRITTPTALSLRRFRTQHSVPEGSIPSAYRPVCTVRPLLHHRSCSCCMCISLLTPPHTFVSMAHA
jgi:hypothetical protein